MLFYFFKKLNSRLIQIFLIKTQQCLLHCLNLTRAIRTIQFFKEHRIFQSAVFHSLNFISKRSNEFLIYHSFQNFQAIFERFFIFSFIRNFAFPNSLVSILSLMIITVFCGARFNIASNSFLSNLCLKIFQFLLNLTFSTSSRIRSEWCVI